MTMYIIGHSIYVMLQGGDCEEEGCLDEFYSHFPPYQKIAKEITLVTLYYSHPQNNIFRHLRPLPHQYPLSARSIFRSSTVWYVVLVRNARQICLAECRTSWQAGRITVHRRCAICQRMHRNKHYTYHIPAHLSFIQLLDIPGAACISSLSHIFRCRENERLRSYP